MMLPDGRVECRLCPRFCKLNEGQVGIVPRKVPRNAFTVVNPIIYRQIESLETAAVAALAREVFDQFVAPHYQPVGVSEFHRYASAGCSFAAT